MSSIANEASSVASRAQQAFKTSQPKTGIQEPGGFAALMDSQSDAAPAPKPDAKPEAKLDTKPDTKPAQKADQPAPRDDASDQNVAPASQPDNSQAAAELAPTEGKPQSCEPVTGETAKPVEPTEAAGTDTNVDPTIVVPSPVAVDPNAAAIAVIAVAAAPVTADAEAPADTAEKPAAIEGAAAPVLPVADENAQPAKKTSGKPAPQAQSAAAPVTDGSSEDAAADQIASAEQPKAQQQPEQAKPEATHPHAKGAPQQAEGDKPQTKPGSDPDSAAPAAKTAGDAPAHLATPAPVAGHSLAAAPAHGQAASPAALAQPVPVNAVAVEIAAQARAGNSRFEIRLDPAELGRIDVRLDVDRDGNVTSRLVIERADTYDLLRRDQSTLERALQQAGLKTSDNSMQFQLRDQGSQNSGFANQQQDDNSGRKTTALIADADVSLNEAASGYARLLRAGGGIDIRV